MITSIEARVEADGFGNSTPILFYRTRDDYGWMSSFAKFSIWLPHPYTGVSTLYLTREHRYQAMKGDMSKDHDYVNDAGTAGEAKTRGGPGGIDLRPGWGETYGELCWYVMLESVMAMVYQHSYIRTALDATKLRPIYEDSPTDDIWGVRHRNDYRGRNLLGRCWMTTRNVIRGGFP